MLVDDILKWSEVQNPKLIRSYLIYIHRKEQKSFILLFMKKKTIFIFFTQLNCNE